MCSFVLHKVATAGAVLLVGVVLSLVACSSNDGKGSPSGSATQAAATSADAKASTAPTKLPDEAAAAKSALLTVADFPTGWAEKPNDKKGDSPLDKCQQDAVKKNQTGRAESGDFSKDGNSTISESIAFYAADGDAQAAIELLRPQLECAVKLINDGRVDLEGVKASKASISPVSYPALGDQMVALRFQFTATAKGTNIDVYYDALYIRQGRVGVGLVGFDMFSPFSSSQLTDIAQKAVAKIPK